MQLPGTLWCALFILVIFIVLEVFNPYVLREGFEAVVGAIDSSNNYFAPLVPRRGDIGYNKEEKGYTMDPRYFHGYVDVQRFGFNHDYCRIVNPGKFEESFFACALAGTYGLPSISYRTDTVANGLQLSRDDYMADVYDENRYAYCRILKTSDGTFQPLCLRAENLRFGTTNAIDPEPPDNIKLLVDFYSGCVVWLRLLDDMLDYTSSISITKAGGISIPEKPNPATTNGLSFNGIDQFLRIYDTPDMTLGSVVPLQSMRAFSLWVYFDEFTNNAHIFDFGDGPGDNNVFLGIYGNGDELVSGNDIRPVQSTLPDYPAGPHPCATMSPQDYMALRANVNEFECKQFDIIPKKLEPSLTAQPQIERSSKATLLYEVWDGKQRKLRIKISKALPLRKWTHVAITTGNEDSVRPSIVVYVDGIELYTEPSGYLPQVKRTTHNYIGKSNWYNQTSKYELQDMLFSGKIFDFRIYKARMSLDKIKKTLEWGKTKLPLLK